MRFPMAPCVILVSFLGGESAKSVPERAIRIRQKTPPPEKEEPEPSSRFCRISKNFYKVKNLKILFEKAEKIRRRLHIGGDRRHTTVSTGGTVSLPAARVPGRKSRSPALPAGPLPRDVQAGLTLKLCSPAVKRKLSARDVSWHSSTG